MPFYEYRCKQCGNIRVLQMSINSDPEEELDCEKCDGKSVRLFPKRYKLKFIGDGFMSNKNLAEYWD